MGQVLHGSATTTEAIRRAIQHGQAGLRVLAKRYGINPRTVATWRARTSVADQPTGPKAPASTVLTPDEEAVVVAFRRHTLLPLDDCLYALQATLPRLTRSSLHRCLQRHGISRLPDVEGEAPPKRKFTRYPIGVFHIDLAELRTAQGRLSMLVAVDRTSKFAVVALHREAKQRTAGDFLRRLAEAVPYRIHTVLTDNGIHVTAPGAGGSRPRPSSPRRSRAASRSGPTRFWTHAFEYACARLGIEHRLTKPKHPWSNGEVERLNRTIKDATVRRYHYGAHEQLERHLAECVTAYTFGRRLKTLRRLTPYEFICKQKTAEPQRFHAKPLHQMPGLNI